MLLVWLLSSFAFSLQLEVPQKWREMCSFTDIAISGVEGQFNNSEFRLQGIGIIFRHGERSSLLEHSDETGCVAYLSHDQERFSRLEEVISSEKFRTFMGITEEKLGSYTAIPERARCASGQLTAEGALQHVMLGEFMRSRYSGSPLFSKDALPSMTVASTNYNRTVQSAIAFSSSFLFPQRERLENITFVVANNTLLCFDMDCHCPYAQRLWKKAHQEQLDTFAELASTSVQKIFKDTQKVNEFSVSEIPSQVLDIALTRFVCRRRNLPCNEDSCLTFEKLDQLYDFSSFRSSHWYNHSEKYMRSSVDDLKTTNFLSRLLDEVQKVKEQPAVTFVRVVSAHDVSIGAVFHSLGVKFEDPVRYTSRVVFEFFEQMKTRDFYFRLLFNGVDITFQLPFCQELTNGGLCPVERLQREQTRLRKKTSSIREKCLQ